MIIGLGTDIVQISRIAGLMEKFGDKFLQRCFTEAECTRADSKTNPAAAYARLYAAKEASLKALGTGMREGLAWHDMEVGHTDLGAPVLTIRNGCLGIIRQKTPSDFVAHLSLSDDGDYAVATVIIETLS